MLPICIATSHVLSCSGFSTRSRPRNDAATAAKFARSRTSESTFATQFRLAEAVRVAPGRTSAPRWWHSVAHALPRARRAVQGAAMPIKVYHYPACSTCRRALKWLDAHGLSHERVDIVASPPSRAELARALGGE